MAKTSEFPISRTELDQIVGVCKDNLPKFEGLMNNLYGDLTRDPELSKLIHSSKFRLKDPSHLREKIRRKTLEAASEGKPPPINKDNVLQFITDIAGIRLIHLHTEQIGEIAKCVDRVLEEQMYVVTEGPTAHTWDVEYRNLFTALGIKTKDRDTLYTSVHYIVQSNSRTKLSCEVQIRTLSEELWGEVSHTVNYPKKTKSVACQEQLKVLARVTSGSTRLVDSIFKSLAEHKRMSGSEKAKKLLKK